MKGSVLILRPQPGAEETEARARARGLEPVVAPLFTIRPVDWTPPPPVELFDAILLTSANAPRHAGPGLSAFRQLTCYAVGDASAAAAREAGFLDVRAGPSDAAAVAGLMAQDGVRRALHPCAAEPAPFPHPGVQIERVPVYAAEAEDRLSDVAVAAIHAGAVALLHSPRAAALLSQLIGERRGITRIAAISDAAAAAADGGWRGIAVASEPRDEALLAAAEEMAVEARAERPRTQQEAVLAPAAGTLQPRRRRAWGWRVAAIAIAFILGMAALLWVMLRFDGVSRFLGLVPDAAEPAPQQAAAPPPVSSPVPAAPDGEVTRRVALLEQRLGELGTDARAAVGNADRAEGLLVAFAARRAVERGVGLGYLEGLLRQRFGQSQEQAVATIVAFSQQPVTLQQLQASFADVGPRMTGVPGQNFWEALKFELANLVIIRREGAASSDPRERLQRATARLDAGQVEEALREALRMPGLDNGRAWIDAARRYVAARQALDAIELAALVEPHMPPQPAPLPAQPAPPQQRTAPGAGNPLIVQPGP